LPKPAEFASTDGLEKEKDAIDAKLRDVSGELKPIMVRTWAMGGLETSAK